MYLIPPHGAHDLNVKFSLDGIRDEEHAWMEFRDVISTPDGFHVDVEPIQFAVD
jgi:hypothetical protein